MKGFSMKIFISFVLIFCIFYNGICQGKLLFVPHVPQVNRSWCWAASMEMVIKFHEPSNTTPFYQSEIFRRYASFIGLTSSTYTNCPYCSTTYRMPVISGVPCGYLTAINFSSEGNLTVDYMDQVFQSLGYQSSQEINYRASPIAWSNLKKQIDDCRPFIVFIDPAGNTIQSNHAIVVKGYSITNGNRFLIANDPFVYCNVIDPISMIFPYENFSNGNIPSSRGISIDRALSIVGNIRQNVVFNQADENCSSCEVINRARQSPCSTNDLTLLTTDNLIFKENFRIGLGGNNFPTSIDTISEKIENDRLVSAVFNNKEKVVGFEKHKLNKEELDYFLDQKQYFGSKVKFLSLDKLAKNFICFHEKNNIPNVIEHEEEVYEMVSGAVDTNIVSTFQKKDDGFWELTKISNYTAIRNTIPLVFEKTTSLNDKIVLSNSKGKGFIEGTVEYELIKLMPYLYEFYSFKSNGKIFLAPANDYPEIKLYKGLAYSEHKVIGILRNISNQYVNQNQKFFSDSLKKRIFQAKPIFGSTKY